MSRGIRRRGTEEAFIVSQGKVDCGRAGKFWRAMDTVMENNDETWEYAKWVGEGGKVGGYPVRVRGEQKTKENLGQGQRGVFTAIVGGGKKVEGLGGKGGIISGGGGQIPSGGFLGLKNGRALDGPKILEPRKPEC